MDAAVIIFNYGYLDSVPQKSDKPVGFWWGRR